MSDFVVTTRSDELDAGATATGSGGTASGHADGISGDVGMQISLTSSTVATHGGGHNSARVPIGSDPQGLRISENFRSETTT